LPRTFATLWRAIGQSEIVHSAIIGWPYPLGWIANPIAIVRGKGLVVVVESSWRRGDESTKPQTWKIRILNAVTEFAGRWSCKHADVALFTHATYRNALHCGSRENSHVAPAVWINETDILDDAIAEAAWQKKIAQPVRMLFAGRLVPGKGVDVLLAALRLLDDRGVKAHVDIIGQGDRRQTCEQAARTFRNAQVSVLDPVPYGAPFFELVRGYHALLLPSLTDEQPRVIFDANSQAVAVVASDTPGIRPHVDHDRTGWLLSSGDPESLAMILKRAMANAAELHSMGMAALATTHGHTHAAMHRTRFNILKRHFGEDSEQ
jgi:glycosyltransferase involved in cell wall biosynthesis